MAALVTLAEAERAIKAGGSAPPSVLEELPHRIEVASGVIEELCGPVVYETFTIIRDGGGRAIQLPDAPATALTVTTAGTDVAFIASTDDGLVYPASGGRFPLGRQNIEITYAAGYLGAIPPVLKEACLEELVFLWQTSRQGARRDMVDVTYTATGYAVPHKVRDLCAGYLRISGTA